MAIDKMMSDAILGTFRNMISECKEKNLSGEDFDNMCAVMAEMEALAEKHNDINAFNGDIMNQNLYAKFSDYYGRALSSAAKQNQEETGYDDSALLNQTVGALKDAITRIKESKEEAIKETEKYGKKNNAREIQTMFQDELLIKPIQDLVDLGEQADMTLPRFLRIQIEKGLDKAMEGSAVQRNGMLLSYEFAKANAPNPFNVEKEKTNIDIFDNLAAKSEFNVPNSQELTLELLRNDYKYDPKIDKWDAIAERWENLLWSLSFWSLSYTKIAPNIEPWSMAENPVASTKKTQAIRPGIFKQEERLLKKYFDMDFMDIFKSDSFIYKVKNNYLGYSQEYVEFLIEKVFPNCIPGKDLENDIIEQRQRFHKEKKEGNPQILEPIKNFRTFYDSQFGEGYYSSKYGEIKKVEANAAAWDLEAFRY